MTNEIQNEECEIKVGGNWQSFSIDAALALEPETLKRCPACNGRVRAHKKAVTGQKAHFEHITGHGGCSRMGKYFDGIPSLHPDPLT